MDGAVSFMLKQVPSVRRKEVLTELQGADAGGEDFLGGLGGGEEDGGQVNAAVEMLVLQNKQLGQTVDDLTAEVQVYKLEVARLQTLVGAEAQQRHASIADGEGLQVAAAEPVPPQVVVPAAQPAVAVLAAPQPAVVVPAAVVPQESLPSVAVSKSSADEGILGGGEGVRKTMPILNYASTGSGSAAEQAGQQGMKEQEGMKAELAALRSKTVEQEATQTELGVALRSKTAEQEAMQTELRSKAAQQEALQTELTALRNELQDLRKQFTTGAGGGGLSSTPPAPISSPAASVLPQSVVPPSVVSPDTGAGSADQSRGTTSPAATASGAGPSSRVVVRAPDAERVLVKEQIELTPLPRGKSKEQGTQTPKFRTLAVQTEPEKTLAGYSV